MKIKTSACARVESLNQVLQMQWKLCCTSVVCNDVADKDFGCAGLEPWNQVVAMQGESGCVIVV